LAAIIHDDRRLANNSCVGQEFGKLLPEYLLLLRFKAWKLILDFNTVCLLVSLEYRCVHPLSSSRMDDYNMGMEDTSEGSLPEAQSKLDREEKQSVQGYIAIKGTRNGLLLTLEPGTPFSELLNALSRRLSEAPTFFRGASLAVDTTRRKLRVNERTELEALLAHYQMSVAMSDVPQVAHSLSMDPHPAAQLTSEQIQPYRYDPRDSVDTIFLRRTIRSGQAIQHAGNIVVMGDINPGAEIIAGGDIIVWGVLRGMVHAGYPDNENAVVCSLSLAPVQLRIAHLLSRPPEGFESQVRPETAAIKNGQIVVEPWVNGRSPRK
jgi:septum site-determining protein MinC